MTPATPCCFGNHTIRLRPTTMPTLLTSQAWRCPVLVFVLDMVSSIFRAATGPIWRRLHPGDPGQRRPNCPARARSMGSRAPNPTDRRVVRTRQTLRAALIALLYERGWDAISVQDICGRAGVGRSTFYTHFADKE